MALKQADQIRYDALVSLIQTLKNLDHDYHTILGAAAPQIKDFQEETGFGVRLKNDFSVELIDRRKDYLRIRNPNEQSKTLRTKVDGVSIDVKIFKEGDYDFENATIAQSLQRLADTVKGLPAELVTFPECEVEEHVSSLVNVKEDESEDADPEDGDSVDENNRNYSSTPDSYSATESESEKATFSEDSNKELTEENLGSSDDHFGFVDTLGDHLEDSSSEETEADKLF